MNDDNSLVLAVFDGVETAFFAVEDNIPFIRSIWVNATEYVHQRGFSSAVLAADGMDLAFLDLYIYLIQRFYAGKFFGDVLHFQKRITQVTFLPILQKETDEGFVRLLSSVVA